MSQGTLSSGSITTTFDPSPSRKKSDGFQRSIADSDTNPLDLSLWQSEVSLSNNFETRFKTEQSSYHDIGGLPINNNEDNMNMNLTPSSLFPPAFSPQTPSWPASTQPNIFTPPERMQPASATKDDTEPMSPENEPSYEYFPLSIDDWTVPVDAVYRPHGVHHKKAKPDSRQNLVKKRYFVDFEQ